MPFPQENFTSKIMGYANSLFIPMHQQFLKPIWGDNRVTAKLPRNVQVSQNWEEGYFEFHLPTADSTHNNLKLMRIVIKVLPYISEETKYAEAYRISKPRLNPCGEIESETRILIAYQQLKPGIVRGFKNLNTPHSFTGVFVSRKRSPELIWKRVLDHLGNFINKRLDGFMRKLGFEVWVWKWLQHKERDLVKENNLLYYDDILGHFSFFIRQIFLSFMNVYRSIMLKMRGLLAEIGENNVALQAIHVLEGLNVSQLGRVFTQIRAGLHVDVELDRDALRVLEVCRRG